MDARTQVSVHRALVFFLDILAALWYTVFAIFLKNV